MTNKSHILLSCLTAAFLMGNTLQAEENFIDNLFGDNNTTNSKDMIIIPYVFASDSTGFVGGAGIIKQGLFQPQTTLIASVMYGATQDIMTNDQEEEAQVLEYFVRNAGKIISCDEIIENVWDDDHIPTHATIRTYIKNLRKMFSKDYFDNIKGEGYRFNIL